MSIRILQAPVFLATKLEALKARMGRDLRTSPDFEDIVFLFSARSTLLAEVVQSEGTVQEYIRREIQSLMARGGWNEAVESAMGYGIGSVALQRVREKFSSLALTR